MFELGKLCARFGVAHVVNNAYGLQSSSTCSLLNNAVRRGARIDAVIASMDKNFMVPVGGAIVIGFNNNKTTDTTPSIHKEKGAGTKGKPTAQNKPSNGYAADADAAAASNSSPESSSVGTVSPGSSFTSIHSHASSLLSGSSASAAPLAPPLPNVLSLVSSLYPGRASSAALTDLFLTLLGMGAEGWRQLLAERERLFPVLKQRLEILAKERGERVLHTPDNPISLAMTLDGIEAAAAAADDAAAGDGVAAAAAENGAASNGAASVASSSTAAASSLHRQFNPSYLGSLLFSRNVSGPRCLSAQHSAAAVIGGLRFAHYGTHCGDGPALATPADGAPVRGGSYPHSYLTAACSLGMREEEIQRFATRLDKCIDELHKQQKKQAQRNATTTSNTDSQQAASVAADSVDARQPSAQA